MSKKVEYVVVEQSTPANKSVTEHITHELGPFDTLEQAVREVEAAREFTNNSKPGMEPWSYHIKKVETMVRGEEEVAAFGKIMLKKLQQNIHKGDFKDHELSDLYELLEFEVEELDRALVDYNKCGCSNCILGVAYECADIANFAMGITDRVGGLDED